MEGSCQDPGIPFATLFYFLMLQASATGCGDCACDPGQDESVSPLRSEMERFWKQGAWGGLRRGHEDMVQAQAVPAPALMHFCERRQWDCGAAQSCTTLDLSQKGREASSSPEGSLDFSFK